ncbi:MAG: HAD family hydrolase [Ruminococcaceae bacterium]|nr:HAD family hydrolase [Oscillospiraceae bacterium]
MNIKAVLFDLDGTLLPMDQDIFIKQYFSALAQKMASKGYEPNKFLSTVTSGTKAMLANDGSATNEERFWDAFICVYGNDAKKDEGVFEEFYSKEYCNLKNFCKTNSGTRKILDLCDKKGLKKVLATNPVFPNIAVKERISWNGMQLSDFEFVTTYDNSKFCKPQPGYYLNIAKQLELTPQECLMVGNDVIDDMSAKDIGMQVFLLTDCLINGVESDLERYPSGCFDELYKFIENLE